MRTVPIKFHPVLIRITQVQGLAHSMVCDTLERDLVLHQTGISTSQVPPLRVQNRKVVETATANRCRRTLCTLPGVEPDVVMVSTGGEKGGRASETLRNGETKYVAIEVDGSIKVRNLEMNMTDTRLCWQYVAGQDYSIS